MKKRLLVLLIVVMLACIVILCACNKDDAHTHVMTYHESVSPTCAQEGNIEHWHCDGCGTDFLDEGGITETTEVSLGIVPHNLTYQKRLEPSCANGHIAHFVCMFCQGTYEDREGKNPITAEALSLQAIKVHVYDGSKCVECGIATPYMREGNTLTFGSYPQSMVGDEAIISKLNRVSNVDSVLQDPSWLAFSKSMKYRDIDLEDQKYRGVVYGGSDPVVLWFLWEPLTWTIINEGTDGIVTVRCNISMDSCAFQKDLTKVGKNYYTNANGAPEGTLANSYQYSAVRKWLNEGFYNTAFSDLHQQLIQSVQLDENSEMNDKVYLISLEEAIAQGLYDPNNPTKTQDLPITSYNDFRLDCEPSFDFLLPCIIERKAFEEKILTPLSQKASQREYVKFYSYYNKMFYASWMAEGKTEMAEAIAKEPVYAVAKKKNIDTYVLSGDISDAAKRELEAMILEYCPEYTYDELVKDHSFTEFKVDISSLGQDFAGRSAGYLLRTPLDGDGSVCYYLSSNDWDRESVMKLACVIPEMKIKLY